MKTYWGVKVQLYAFLTSALDIWRWVVSFTPRPLYRRGKSPRYPLDRRLGGPQSLFSERGKWGKHCEMCCSYNLYISVIRTFFFKSYNEWWNVPIGFNFRAINSMKQSPSWEVNTYSASQEIIRLLWNPKLHYRVHKSPPLDLILGQMTPIHTFALYFPKIHSDIIYPSMPKSLPSGLFPSGFTHK